MNTPTFVTRLAMCLLTIHLSAVPSIAKEETAANGGAASEGVFKGTVQKPEKPSSAGSLDEKRPTAQIFLMAHITESPERGLKSTIEPYYTDKSGLSAEEYGKLVASPLVSGRLAKWRTWYSRLFSDISAGGSIPEDVAGKYNVSIDREGKVDANPEWVVPSKKPSSKAWTNSFLSTLRGLGTKHSLAFPDKSYLDRISFDVYLSYEHEYELAANQPLDYD